MTKAHGGLAHRWPGSCCCAADLPCLQELLDPPRPRCQGVFWGLGRAVASGEGALHAVPERLPLPSSQPVEAFGEALTAGYRLLGACFREEEAFQDQEEFPDPLLGSLLLSALDEQARARAWTPATAASMLRGTMAVVGAWTAWEEEGGQEVVVAQRGCT